MVSSIRIVVMLTALTVAVAVAAGTSLAAPNAARNVSARDALELQVLGEINVLRRRHGLAALRMSNGLRAAADAHSSSMVRAGFFAHGDFSRRVARYYPRGRYRTWSIGENLLWSSPDIDAAQAVQLWLNSPSHRKILLTARWREIGLSAVHVDAGPGVFNGAPVTVVTADFGVRR
jgi:uncharacterized protein YkwD